MSHVIHKTVSVELPAGVNVVIWQGDDETVINGEIRSITLQLDVPMDEATKVRAKLRGLVGQL
jgi:hypothetical protein